MATESQLIEAIMQPLANGIEAAIASSGVTRKAFVLVVFTEDEQHPGMFRPQFVANADVGQVMIGLEEMVKAYKANDVAMVDPNRGSTH